MLPRPAVRGADAIPRLGSVGMASSADGRPAVRDHGVKYPSPHIRARLSCSIGGSGVMTLPLSAHGGKFLPGERSVENL